MLNPITFSIPKQKIIEGIDIDKIVSAKTKIMSDLVPGKKETYIYNTEESYYDEYRLSFFATTTKKAGWDCLRHYEILANGCIPFFPNIKGCNYNTLALFPKKMIIEGNELYERIQHKNVNRLSIEELNDYKILLQKILDYTKNYLTTEEIAKYVLRKSGIENIKRILFLSGDTYPDYLRCLTLHGFKSIFGRNCHDYPIVPHLYKLPYINQSELYGMGYSYSCILDPKLHDNSLDDKVKENIINKYYDIVIYGSYHRGIPFYDLVSNVYDADRIILFCGEDIFDNRGLHHVCDYPHYLQKGHCVFVREL